MNFTSVKITDENGKDFRIAVLFCFDSQGNPHLFGAQQKHEKVQQVSKEELIHEFAKYFTKKLVQIGVNPDFYQTDPECCIHRKEGGDV